MKTQMERLAQVLPKGADAAVIMTRSNRRYFTGFDATDGILILSKQGNLFLTDGRYTAAALRAAEDKEPISTCEIVESANRGDFENALKKLNIKTAVVEKGITLKEYDMLRTAAKTVEFGALAELDNSISAMRQVKTKQEAEKIKQAANIANQAFLHILGFIEPGVTEQEIAFELECFMRGNGAEGVAFETIVTSGENTVFVHGSPTQKKVEKNDFVLMDFGAVYGGYKSDMTRTVAVGGASERMKEIYQIVLSAQQAALGKIVGGVKCSEIDKAAREVIEQAGGGSYYRHAVGHGVGLDIHEEPTLSVKSAQVLEEGMVVTAEPGIYIDHAFGVRIEDMVMVTGDGHFNFSDPGKELIIL